ASDGEFPLLLAPMAVAFMDSVLFFVMPQPDFDEKYNTRKEKKVNSKYYTGNKNVQTRLAGKPKVAKAINDPHKRLGIEKFRDFDYLGAIEAFQKSLQKNYESPSTHFNLACSYSMLELPKDAFYHLEKAVEFGFDAHEKINTHQALSFLRTQPDFDAFVKKGFKTGSTLSLDKTPFSSVAPTETEVGLELEELEPVESPNTNLLDQLLQLGELKEKGLLSEEEFNKQKQKLLRD
ncbi:MAG: SHOCT domain-containing protein, partial [Bacteroidota bacterium]